MPHPWRAYDARPLAGALAGRHMLQRRRIPAPLCVAAAITLLAAATAEGFAVEHPLLHSRAGGVPHSTGSLPQTISVSPRHAPWPQAAAAAPLSGDRPTPQRERPQGILSAADRPGYARPRGQRVSGGDQGEQLWGRQVIPERLRIAQQYLDDAQSLVARGPPGECSLPGLLCGLPGHVG